MSCRAGSPVFEQYAPREFIAQGDKVVVLGQERFRVKATGRSVENEWAHGWTLREGRAARFYEYNDTAALAAGYRGA